MKLIHKGMAGIACVAIVMSAGCGGSGGSSLGTNGPKQQTNSSQGQAVVSFQMTSKAPESRKPVIPSSGLFVECTLYSGQLSNTSSIGNVAGAKFTLAGHTPVDQQVVNVASKYDSPALTPNTYTLVAQLYPAGTVGSVSTGVGSVSGTLQAYGGAQFTVTAGGTSNFSVAMTNAISRALITVNGTNLNVANGSQLAFGNVPYAAPVSYSAGLLPSFAETTPIFLGTSAAFTTSLDGVGGSLTSTGTAGAGSTVSGSLTQALLTPGKHLLTLSYGSYSYGVAFAVLKPGGAPGKAIPYATGLAPTKILDVTAENSFQFALEFQAPKTFQDVIGAATITRGLVVGNTTLFAAGQYFATAAKVSNAAHGPVTVTTTGIINDIDSPDGNAYVLFTNLSNTYLDMYPSTLPATASFTLKLSPAVTTPTGLAFVPGSPSTFYVANGTSLARYKAVSHISAVVDTSFAPQLIPVHYDDVAFAGSNVYLLDAHLGELFVYDTTGALVNQVALTSLGAFNGTERVSASSAVAGDTILVSSHKLASTGKPGVIEIGG